MRKTCRSYGMQKVDGTGHKYFVCYMALETSSCSKARNAVKQVKLAKALRLMMAVK